MDKRVANCQSKKVYRTAKKAIKAKDRYAGNEIIMEYQRHYRCPICLLWHLTKRRKELDYHAAAIDAD